MMIEITATERWRNAFPNAHVGVLLIENIDNTRRETPLEGYKRTLEERLRAMYAGQTRTDLRQHPILKAYHAYYKKFGKSYHVQLQLESIALKGKALPAVSPLVDANFAAELETLVISAGHDADLLVAPLTIDVSQGNEAFVMINGKTRQLKPNDMLMRDGQRVISTILYGQDAETLISAETTRALFTAYAPQSVPVAALRQHLDQIAANIYLAEPNANVVGTAIFGSEGTVAHG